jgi:hypothetical protein
MYSILPLDHRCRNVNVSQSCIWWEKPGWRKNPGEIVLQQNMTRRQTEHRRLLYHKQHYENVPIRETDDINEAKPQDIAKFLAQKGLKLRILAKQLLN